jgi:hypothetical protein
MEVRFEYRGAREFVVVPLGATADEVRAAIAARLPELDAALDLAEMVGAEVEA